MVLFTKDIGFDGLIKRGAEFKKFDSVEELLAAIVLGKFGNKGITGIQKGFFLDSWGKIKNPSVIDLEILNGKVFGSGVRTIEPYESATINDGYTRIFPVEPVYVPVYEQDYAPFYPPAPQKDLRDEFAMAALPAAIELFDRRFSDPNRKRDYLIADYAYQIANAMMARRKK